MATATVQVSGLRGAKTLTVPDAPGDVVEQVREAADLDNIGTLPASTEIGTVEWDDASGEVVDLELGEGQFGPLLAEEHVPVERREGPREAPQRERDPERGQMTLEGEGEPAATQQRLPGAVEAEPEQEARRRGREAQRRSERRSGRQQGQLGLDTATETERLGEFEDVDEEMIRDEPIEPGPDERNVPRSEAEQRFVDDERGRILHHAEHNTLGGMLRSISPGGAARRSLRERFDSPDEWLDYWDDRGTFEAVDGVGDVADEALRAAVPLVREGIENRGAPESADVADDVTIAELVNEYGPEAVLAAGQSDMQGPLTDGEFAFVQEQAADPGARVPIPVETGPNISQTDLTIDVPGILGGQKFRIGGDVDEVLPADAILEELEYPETIHAGDAIVGLQSGDYLRFDPNEEVLDRFEAGFAGVDNGNGGGSGNRNGGGPDTVAAALDRPGVDVGDHVRRSLEWPPLPAEVNGWQLFAPGVGTPRPAENEWAYVGVDDEAVVVSQTPLGSRADPVGTTLTATYSDPRVRGNFEQDDVVEGAAERGEDARRELVEWLVRHDPGTHSSRAWDDEAGTPPEGWELQGFSQTGSQTVTVLWHRDEGDWYLQIRGRLDQPNDFGIQLYQETLDHLGLVPAEEWPVRRDLPPSMTLSTAGQIAERIATDIVEAQRAGEIDDATT